MLQEIIEGNRRWVDAQLAEDPEYFKKLAKGQEPKYLYIGCSDSRIPTSRITDTKAGGIFVHRNIANMVVHSDLSMLSVLQYSVEVLKVEAVMVVGHYGCGGVAAAEAGKPLGLIDNWLGNIKQVIHLHEEELNGISDQQKRLKRLVELNVMEQVRNLRNTSVMLQATNPPKVYGLVYDLSTGELKELPETSEASTQA